MNSRQLQYAVLLSQVRSFSQVAQMLNMSQPALSKQIINLENELNIKLFNRNSSPLTLTPAGKYFAQEAQALLYKEDQLLRSMEQFRSGQAGQLDIAVSPFRCLYLIPEVIEKVRKKFPNVQVVLHETSSTQLRKETEEGKYDFSILNLPVEESLLEIIPLEPDNLVLVVPQQFAQTLPQCNSLSLEDCRNIPFVVVGQNQEMRMLFDKLCASAGIYPNIAAEVMWFSSAWALANAGVGATLLPLQFVERASFQGNLRTYQLKRIGYSRQPAIVYRKGQYLSPYAQYAIQLLTEK